MDNQEQGDQVMQKLSRIERELRSLRYTFGIGIIVLAVFLTCLAPTLMSNFSTQRGWGAPNAMNQGGLGNWMPPARDSGTQAPVAPTATTTP